VAASNQERKRIRRLLAAHAVFLGLLPPLLGWTSFGTENQIEQIPLVLRALDPGYLVRDYFVSANMSYGPRTFYTGLVALGARVMPLPLVFLLGACVARGLIAWVTSLTALHLFRSPLAAMLAATVAVAVEGVQLGGAAELDPAHLIPQQAALPFALAALALGLRGRLLSCALLSLPALLLHPLVGFELGGLGIAAGALSRLRASPRVVRAWLGRAAVAVALLAAAMAAIWVIPTGAGGRSEAFFTVLIGFRLPHHYLPSHFPAANYAYFASALAGGAVLMALLRREEVLEDQDLRSLIWLLALMLSSLLLGYVFVEVWPSALVTSAQLFRLTLVLKWVAALLAGGAAAWLWEQRQDLGAKGVAALMVLGTGAIQPLLFLASALLSQARRRLEGRSSDLALGGLAVVALVTASLAFGRGHEIEVTVGGATLAVLSVTGFANPRTGRLLRVLPAALVCVLFLLQVAARLSPEGPAGALLGDRRLCLCANDPRRPEHGATEFAGANLPEDALLLAPPHLGHLRFSAARALLLDFKMLGYEEATVETWLERVEAVFGRLEKKGFAALAEMNGRYAALADRDLLRLGARYGVDHAILFSPMPTKLPTLYADRWYKVVRVPGAGPGDAPTKGDRSSQ
jgi:hypothetical protein